MLILGDDDAGELALGLVFCTVLVAITLTDLELRVIPNKIVSPSARSSAVAIVAATDPASLAERRSPRRRRAASCSWSRSPIRGGWAWGT